MSDLTTTIIVVSIFFATIVGLIRYQNYPARVFGVTLLALYISNVVSTEQVLTSFANQGLLTLIMLMTCSLALEKTKLLRLITSYVIKQKYSATWGRLFGLTVISSAFLNNTAVVSTMLSPIRNNDFHPSSKLLIPLSYAAIFGGTLTLVGTSTNLIVNSMVLGQHGQPLGFFEFTPIGLCIAIVGGVTLYLASRFLPSNKNDKPKSSQYFIDAKVSAESTLVGKSIEANGLRNLESLFLVEILRRGRLISPVSPSEEIEAGDRLMFTGDIKKVTVLNQFDGLDLYAHKNGLPINNLREVVVKPESVLIGKSLKQSGFRALFDAAVVAMRRDGESISGKLGDRTLSAGDYLVLAVGEDFKGRHNIAKNFFLISGLEVDKLLSPLQEKISIAGFFLAIFLAAIGVLSLFKGMLVLLGVLLLSGSLHSNEIMQRLPKQIWLIIASALLLSHALINSGALEYLRDTIQDNNHILTPLMGLVIVYCLTWITTELVTNNAAAALIFPIAYSLGSALSITTHAYILAVAFGASASFISPYGYQTNLMVFNAGKYHLRDFVKVGVPISIVYGTTVITAIYFLVGL